MAKSASNTVLDGLLNVIKNNSTRITVCSAEPTTYAEANATYALAGATIDSSDFTIGDGDVSGRKVTVAGQSDASIDSDGSATHVALLDVSGTALLFVTTCTPQALTTGNTVTLSPWDIEVSDPA